MWTDSSIGDFHFHFHVRTNSIDYTIRIQ